MSDNNEEMFYMVHGAVLKETMQYLETRPLKEGLQLFIALNQAAKDPFTVELVAKLIVDGRLDRVELDKMIKDIEKEKPQPPPSRRVKEGEVHKDK